MKNRKAQVHRLKLSVFMVFCISWLLACGTTNTGDLDGATRLWDIYYNEPQTVMIVAHRGAHNDLPENSLASIDRAVEEGAHIVELDVRKTKDGVFVIMHDHTLDRTTTGAGEVENYTYEELMDLYLLHDGQATTHTIPTMEEALLKAKGQILVDIDFKVSGLDARYEAYDEIARLGVEDIVLFFCYDYTDVQALHAYNPRIKVMPRAYDLIQVKEIIDSGLTDIVHVDGSYYDPIAIAELINGKHVRIWANVLGSYDQAAAQEGAEAYYPFFERMVFVNVVQTDHPLLLGKALSQWTDTEELLVE